MSQLRVISYFFCIALLATGCGTITRTQSISSEEISAGRSVTQTSPFVGKSAAVLTILGAAAIALAFSED